MVIEETPQGLRVGMADPTDLTAYDEIARIVRREIELVVVAESQLLGAIDRSYRHTEAIAGLAQRPLRARVYSPVAQRWVTDAMDVKQLLVRQLSELALPSLHNRPGLRKKQPVPKRCESVS